MATEIVEPNPEEWVGVCQVNKGAVEKEISEKREQHWPDTES